MMMDLKNGNISQVLFFEGLRNIISTRKAKDFESIGFADEILFPDKITRMKFRITRSVIRNVVTHETRRNDTKAFSTSSMFSFSQKPDVRMKKQTKAIKRKVENKPGKRYVLSI